MKRKLSDLTAAELDELLDIHCALSPENLSADGERARHEVNRLYRELSAKLGALKTRLNVDTVDEGPVYAEWAARGRPAAALLRSGK